MVALFWLLVLLGGVITGQPWAIVIFVVLIVLVILANSHVPVDPQGRPIRKQRPARVVPPPRPRVAQPRPVPRPAKVVLPPRPHVTQPRPAKVPWKLRRPHPTARDPWDEMRRLQQLQRKWREEDHRSWEQEFNTLVRGQDPRA